MKALIVVFVLAVVGVVLFVFVVGNLLNDAARNLGIDPGGSNGGLVGGSCPFLSDGDARQVFGGNASAVELSGIYEMTLGLVMDKRVLANAPDCWVADGTKASIARVALYEGGDASAVFAAERKAAEPTSQDQGGGVTLENEGYFGGEVSNLGDEAFCTGIAPAIMAGVVVRQGDRVVYVSVGPAAGGQAPGMALESGVTTSPELCAFAQEVARFILR